MDEAALRKVSGTVFNIQHYSIHDGPGIRTNVFVKGCPLRCLWCANPESQSPVPQLMFRADKCTGCGACISQCPAGAVILKDGTVRNDRNLCTGCGACVGACPNGAREIVGERKTAGEVFDEVFQDELFYAGDGGVTVTGGEALAQPEFSAAVLALCRKAGVSTAVETCGFADWDVLESVLKYTDLVLFDVKAADARLHKRFTGADNGLILENLKKTDRLTDCGIWVRVPVIPGCNDGADNIAATASFVKNELSRCTQIHLLPFHRLGEAKYHQLENEPNGFASEVPDDAYMESLRDIVRGFGLECR